MAAAINMSKQSTTAKSWKQSLYHKHDISAGEEHDLLLRWHDGGELAARDELVLAFMPRVQAMARGLRHYPVDQDDLVSEGALGLLVGIDRFEPSRNVRLMTYASHWIRAYMVNAIIKDWGKGKTGMGITRSRMFFRVRRDRARYSAQHDDSGIAMSRMAEDMGISLKRLEDMLHALDTPDFSLDSYAEASGQSDLRDRIADPSASPDEAASGAETDDIVSGKVGMALSSLDDRERLIATRRLMDDEPATLADIGREIGVSRERARQIELRAKRKIRTVFASAGLGS